MTLLGLMVAGGMDVSRPWARAQTPTGLTHTPVAVSRGFTLSDAGRGVGVYEDGSILWTGTELAPPPTLGSEDQPMSRAAFVARQTPDGALCWLVEFTVADPSVDEVAPRGLAVVKQALQDPPVPGSSSFEVGYVVGRYRGSATFGAVPAEAGQPGVDRSFVAQIEQTAPQQGGQFCPAPGAGVTWLRVFKSEAQPQLPNQATCVLPQSAGGVTQGTDASRFAGRVVVGGFFEGATRFGPQLLITPAPGDQRNGYVMLLDPNQSSPVQGFAITGAGNQQVTAIALEERTGDLFVAGWYDGPTDLDPGPGTTTLPNPGGRNIFLARYAWSDQPPQSPPVLVSWTTIAGATDEEPTGLAVGVNDDAGLSPLVFISGWRREVGVNLADPLFGALVSTGDALQTKWLHVPPGGGDERALSVAADGLGRPVFSGHVGCPRPAIGPPIECSTEPGPDLDPGPGELRLAYQGLDAFVARYHPITGGLDWAYSVGGEFNEIAHAVAIDPAYSARVTITGSFGGSSPIPGASVDLDPAPASQRIVMSAGQSDAFLSVLEPSTPAGVRTQVSLLINNGADMRNVPAGATTSDYQRTMDALRQHLADPAVVPTTSRVQMNAVVDTVAPLQNTTLDAGRKGRQIMPWTVFDPATAPLFARRLASLRPPESVGGPDNSVASALDVCGQSLGRDFGVASANAHSGVLVISRTPQVCGDGECPSPSEFGDVNIAAMRAAAQAVTTAAENVDRISVLGGRGWRVLPPTVTQGRLRSIEALVRPAFTTPADTDRLSSGFAAYFESFDETGPFGFSETLKRMLSRMSWCPSNYSRDLCTPQQGDATQDQIGSSDEAAWSVGVVAGEPYADWNFDRTVGNTDDREKIERWLPSPGTACGCPN